MTHSIPYPLTTSNILQAIDTRYYQFFVQVGLFVWATFYLDVLMHPMHVVLTIAAGVITQIAFSRYFKLPINLLSTLNSMMSILILLHSSSWMWMVLAAIIAISSKFIIRCGDKHIFNPSNIGIVMVLLLVPETWADSGQWGQGMWFILLLASLGLILLLGISRMLTSISFIATFIGLIFIRAYWLDAPLALPLHQLQNGAILIFAFLMLSDPITTPNSAFARIIFGAWIALFSCFLQYQFFVDNAFLYALAVSMPLVLVLNRLFIGKQYHWPRKQRRY
ncbi:MAG: RnfABCDGE type electron transport complex subunit D [Thiotrichaceae bacterium]|nr:RnfABCDGE type electron transport complex subunit D [Thiotrichaceae bacterium]